MKKYLIIVFCFFITSIYAQADSTAQKKLSKDEFQQAKELYAKMLNSSDYIELTKKIFIVTEKLNNVPYPKIKTENLKSFEPVRDELEVWLDKNLSKTKFKNKEEGVSLMMETLELNGKVLKDNMEVHQLMRRANREQLNQILEIDNSWDRYSERLKYKNNKGAN
jgi:hypothetical protein